MCAWRCATGGVCWNTKTKEGNGESLIIFYYIDLQGIDERFANAWSQKQREKMLWCWWERLCSWVLPFGLWITDVEDAFVATRRCRRWVCFRPSNKLSKMLSTEQKRREDRWDRSDKKVKSVDESWLFSCIRTWSYRFGALGEIGMSLGSSLAARMDGWRQTLRNRSDSSIYHYRSRCKYKVI